MEWIISFIFMIICAVKDIKSKTIPVWMIVLFGIIAILYSGFWGNRGLLPTLYSLIPGAFLLTLSLCTRESIGYGDGLLMLPLGMLVGLSVCVRTVVWGMVMSGVCALILLVCRKAKGKTQIPFIPFLTMGLGVVFFAGNIR